MCIRDSFNTINDVLTVKSFKDVFERRNSDVLLPGVPEVGTIEKYMLHCQWISLYHTSDEDNELNKNNWTQAQLDRARRVLLILERIT